MIISIHKCRREAETKGFDSMQFFATFPSGKHKCQWLDAYLGLFKILDNEEFKDNFLTVSQVEDLCEGCIIIGEDYE